MPTGARLFFDYVDPLSYVWDRAVAVFEASRGLTVVRAPFELVVPPAELVDPESEVWLARWSEAREAAPEGEPPLLAPALVPWTRKAHELALHAEEKGIFRDVHDRIFRAAVTGGRDVGRVDVLVALAVEAGLDRTETKTVLDIDRYTDTVRSLREEAERLGVRGVPTLLAGNVRIEGGPVRELTYLLETL